MKCYKLGLKSAGVRPAQPFKKLLKKMFDLLQNML